MRWLALGVLTTLAVVGTGCPSRESSVASPPPAVVTVPLASGSATSPVSSPAPADPSPPTARRESDPSKWKPGDLVIARGHVSKLYSQHMISAIEGKREAYFDLSGNHPQTIVYWTTAPMCSGDIEVTGKVLEVRGHSKRPSERESKVDDTYRELHLDVSTARCVE